MSAVPVTMVISPRICLWYPELEPARGPLVEEFVKISHDQSLTKEHESFDELLDRSIRAAIQNLGLPYVAKIEIEDGQITVYLDVLEKFKEASPSIMYH